MSRVTTTVRAGLDLDEIWSYVAVDSQEAADSLLDEIDAHCHLLATQPKMGRPRPELAPELRSFPVVRYVIFYRPQANGIEIVRVLHGARDIGRAFQVDRE